MSDVDAQAARQASDLRPLMLVGAAGQLGRSLAPRLAALGPFVAVTRAEMDLSQPSEIRRVMREIRPRLVVNAAAYTSVDAAEGDVEDCRRINAIAPGILAEEAALLDAPIVHFSTNYVFDGTAKNAYTELDEVRPLNVYGRSKAEGERAVAAANSAHAIFRTAGVYGRNASNFLTRILHLASERSELRIVDDQIVSPTPSWLLARAAVGVVERWLGRGVVESETGVLHLTTTGATSWYGFAREILALTPPSNGVCYPPVLPISSEEYATAAQRPRNGVLCCDKFMRESEMNLPDWRDALRETLARPG